MQQKIAECLKKKDRIAHDASGATIFLFTSGLILFVQGAHVAGDRVVAYDRKLVLLSRGREPKSYQIALGGDPSGPKTRQGEHRTPEGLYSLDSRNPLCRYCKAFHISYPTSRDVAAAKKSGVNAGGGITVQGLPKEYAWLGKSDALHDYTRRMHGGFESRDE